MRLTNLKLLIAVVCGHEFILFKLNQQALRKEHCSTTVVG